MRNSCQAFTSRPIEMGEARGTMTVEMKSAIATHMSSAL